MEKGAVIIAKTHAEFLNKLDFAINQEKNISNGGSARFSLFCDLDIWFIRLNNSESKEGWTNSLPSENKIIENYTGDPNKRLESHEDFNFIKKRAIFDITEPPSGRKYIFRGIF